MSWAGFSRRLVESARMSSAASRPSRAKRSEEHTSELQSQSNLVCRLLLEKKKTVTKRKRVIGERIFLGQRLEPALGNVPLGAQPVVWGGFWAGAATGFLSCCTFAALQRAV